MNSVLINPETEMTGTCPNLHTAPLAELVAWYNDNSGKSPLKAFRNRDQAQERCMALLGGAETEEEAEEAHSALSLAGQMAGLASSVEKAGEEEPDLISLAEICKDLGLEPRIARRKLRKALDKVGIGGRWAWEPDSAELATVRGILA